MAKKKQVRRSRKKPKRSRLFIQTIKRIVIGAFIVVLCFIGLLFIYNYFYPLTPTPKTEKVVVEKKEKASFLPDPSLSSNKKQSKISSTKTFRIPAALEIPDLQRKITGQVIRHEGYTVSYNSDYCIANWVAYALTAEEATSKVVERSNKFIPDPAVKGATAMNEDYTRTGYDRGHLAPAGDMKWSAKAMRESFYFSNICPQKPGLNRGIWKELEEQSRLWAKENGTLFIVTGPVITSEMKRLGKNRVGVPEKFYKVLCYHTGKAYKTIGFIFENRDYKNQTLKSMAIPVDSVEKITQIDFFPQIPDAEERKAESETDLNFWSF